MRCVQCVLQCNEEKMVCWLPIEKNKKVKVGSILTLKDTEDP